MSKRVMNALNECLPIFDVLANKTRQEIVVLLDDNGEMSVTEIVEEFGLPRTTVSHHLLKLTKSGLINFHKKGTERLYFITLDESVFRLEKLLTFIKEDRKK